jgi:DNA-binding MarR family transcriptional regulator
VGAVKVRAPEASEKQVQAWINLQQANRVLEGLLEHRLQSEANLSVPEFEVLFRLQISAGHPLQMSEIAAQLINSPSGTTRIADRLERAGLIERETPRENRRVVHVKLTERGRGVLEQADRAFREALHETFAAHLSESEMADLRGTLRKLLESNGAWFEARCEPVVSAET